MQATGCQGRPIRTGYIISVNGYKSVVSRGKPDILISKKIFLRAARPFLQRPEGELNIHNTPLPTGGTREDVEMEMKRVSEVMIPLESYPHVYEGDTLLDAIKMMRKAQIDTHGRKSLPRVVLVFDRKEKLAGMLRRRDIFRGLEPEYLRKKPLDQRKKLFDIQIDPDLSDSSRDDLIKGILARAELSIDHLVHGLKERAKTPVEEMMRATDITIDYNDIFIKAIYEMVDNNRSLLPVVNEGKVVGVVRSVDMLEELGRVVLGGE